MATKKEINKHLLVALQKIGAIAPWHDEEYDCWVFSHPLYPTVECDGETAQEVEKNYPLYLHDFIEERLNENLAPTVEKQTKGRGGFRPRSRQTKENA